MADYEVKFNTTELLNGVSEAFHQTNEVMSRNVAQEVRSNKWPWPRETIRKRTGKTGSPRDIQDEGTFAASQDNERISATVHEHRFDTTYALAVVMGAVMSNGTTLPARNVFKEPLEKFPKNFEVQAQAELAKVKDPPI